MPFAFLTFLAVSMLRGVGDSKTPLYFQAGSLLATAIFDPILMFGWLGFPKMGVNGTAVASVTMQGLGIIATYAYLHHKKHIVTPHWAGLSVEWPMLWLIVKIGLPSVVQQSLISLGMLFVMGIISGFGENAIAAFGAAMRIDQIAFLPAMTFGAAVATLVGQNIGASQIPRVKEVFKWGVIVCGGITLAMTTILVAIPHIVLRMFLDQGTALQIAVHYLRIMGIGYISFAMMFVANGVINGAGYTFVTTIISLVSLWVARVPLAIYLSHRMHRVEGAFIAMAISAFVSMLISQICYMSGFWKKPIVQHHLQPDNSEAEAEDVKPFPAVE
jgi:putative MATE family efflux protein